MDLTFLLFLQLLFTLTFFPVNTLFSLPHFSQNSFFVSSLFFFAAILPTAHLTTKIMTDIQHRQFWKSNKWHSQSFPTRPMLDHWPILEFLISGIPSVT